MTVSWKMPTSGNASRFTLTLIGFLVLPLGVQAQRTPAAIEQQPTGWFGVRIFDQVTIVQSRPARFEYRLTEKGKDLYPIIVSLTRWGDRWMAGKAGPPVELVHKGCGRTIMPGLACPECGESVAARDMVARPGPALRGKWPQPPERRV